MKGIRARGVSAYVPAPAVDPAIPPAPDDATAAAARAGGAAAAAGRARAAGADRPPAPAPAASAHAARAHGPPLPPEPGAEAWRCSSTSPRPWSDPTRWRALPPPAAPASCRSGCAGTPPGRCISASVSRSGRICGDFVPANVPFGAAALVVEPDHVLERLHRAAVEVGRRLGDVEQRRRAEHALQRVVVLQAGDALVVARSAVWIGVASRCVGAAGDGRQRDGVRLAAGALAVACPSPGSRGWTRSSGRLQVRRAAARHDLPARGGVGRRRPRGGRCSGPCPASAAPPGVRGPSSRSSLHLLAPLKMIRLSGLASSAIRLRDLGRHSCRAAAVGRLVRQRCQAGSRCWARRCCGTCCRSASGRCGSRCRRPCR